MKTLRTAWKLCLLALVVATAHAAAAFDVVDTQGHRHRLADYQGRWVVINYWATWCAPCVAEIPEIAAFSRAHPDVVVIGVAIDADDPSMVKRFAAKVGITYPLVLSDERVERELGSPSVLPTTRIYDPRGHVAYDHVGRIDRATLESVTGGKKPAKA
jgi:thiol-disulfide isomerase/thioredoxin